MKSFLPICCLALAALVAGCRPGPGHDAASSGEDTAAARDMHTFSNAGPIAVSHLSLDLDVSFGQRQLRGQAVWDIDNSAHHLPDLVLDTHGLRIDSTFADGRPVAFRMGSADSILGMALFIPVTATTKTVTVRYHTDTAATALKWLDPQQTAGKKFPFLYTQSEAIFARTWIPCPDGPGIRFRYDARITVPKDLLALMSAENPQQRNDSGVYRFHMGIPVPAYLMALAVGDLRFHAVDARSGVYAEPPVIDKAAYELADMGKMINTAEQLYGPYQWGRYDVLVLPPSFPIGGMENPKLTFATPTIIAGDRSLVNLIAHELAHNWSGNLVTNATWNDIWMNEGFTVYFERRIMEAITDSSYSDMLWELGYEDLVAEVKTFGAKSPDTWLKLNLTRRDPDEGLSDIPYEKGALFLWLLEKNFGRASWDAFLKSYFHDHAFQTITTEQFLTYLDAHLIHGDSAQYRTLRINEWVYGPGIPSNAPRALGARFKKVDAALAQFLGGAPAAQLPVSGWSTHEWLHFLRGIPASVPVARLQSLDGAFHFTTTGNSEIADLWYLISLKANYETAYAAMDHFLSTVGRRKFLEPLYRTMMETGKQELARSIYRKYRANYHPVTQHTIDKIVM